MDTETDIMQGTNQGIPQVEISSSIIGVVILVISLAFLLLYLRFVYRIEEAP